MSAETKPKWPGQIRAEKTREYVARTLERRRLAQEKAEARAWDQLVRKARGLTVAQIRNTLGQSVRVSQRLHAEALKRWPTPRGAVFKAEFAGWHLYFRAEAPSGSGWRRVVLVRSEPRMPRRGRRARNRFHLAWSGDRLAECSELGILKRRYPGVAETLTQTLETLED